MSVLRAYWYSGVPSSSTASRSRNCPVSSRASCGVSFWGSVIWGSTSPVSVPESVVVPMRMVVVTGPPS